MFSSFWFWRSGAIGATEQGRGMGFERIAQRRRTADHEREGEPGELPRKPRELVHLAAQHDALRGPFENAGGREELPARRGEVGLEKHLDGERPRQRRDREGQVGERVEPGRLREALLERAHRLDPVQAEGAQPAAQVAVAHGIPVPAAVHEAVRVEVALGFVSPRGAVAHPNARLGFRGGGERAEHEGGGVRVGGAREVERHGFVDRAHAPFQVGRHHALELGLGAADGGRAFRESEPARGEQTDREGERLVVGEHHRGQLVPGDEHVGAVAPALGRDRNAELLEGPDVAAHGARVHLEPPRELRAAHPAVGLEQLEHREDACRRPGHEEECSSK